MSIIERHLLEIAENGFTTIDHVFSEQEIEQIVSVIDLSDKSKETFRKSADLFAIRQFLNEIPQTKNLVFSDALKNAVSQLFGNDYFVVKSIYFDKPATSNWYVAYHQDLTISVNKKLDLDGYGPWTDKQNQYAVQPPLDILENIFTIRIHLDETNRDNGALKVIAGSHLKQIYRPESIDWTKETETYCDVAKGGIMIMKPLLLHSSSRTTNEKRRRVIHIEFSNKELPNELRWAERFDS
jgi:ectoine hydroxylase-related dioxygenase (phytanoyl-CoA dioxygenase family)